ncbi:PTS lactose/cellobiose transporter subunit IIA, partial [Bacillus sp. WP8]|uniref:PTS lactose/cellobiose transporter subunit IIA n=1 Tax=Bacillus sp. WP8 TaxID=756828 RepID=UPI0011A11C46
MRVLEEMEGGGFEMIGDAGEGRSDYVEGIGVGRGDDFEKGEELMEKGEEGFGSMEKVELWVIEKEGGGEEVGFCLVVIEGEDEMVRRERIDLLVMEMIE